MRPQPSLASLFLIAALGCPSCASAPTNASTSADVTRGLPAYSGQPADEFDDTIEPHAVGLELETYASPKNDPALRRRAEAADLVARARVATVTGKSEAGNRSYELSFKTVERLAGKREALVGDDFTVRIDRASPSLGIEEHGRTAHWVRLSPLPRRSPGGTGSVTFTSTPPQTAPRSRRP